MAKKELVKGKVDIKTIEGENHSQVFIMSMYVGGMTIYEKAKATDRFINKETKVLEQVLEGVLRNYLREQGIIVQDGSPQALEKAIWELEQKGKSFDIVDRYLELENETIIGESPNHMTIVEEENILSVAMEVIIYG